jgi:methionine-rich copper-binding protein CopC
MKMAGLVCALILIGYGPVAGAHARFAKAVPANGSTVTVSPPNFVLTFAEPVKMTALSLQKGTDPKQKLGPLPSVPTAEISVPAPKLTAGKYVLSWVVVGDDGHVMPGKVSFTVAQSATGVAPGATS